MASHFEKGRGRRVRFERNAARVVFDPTSQTFVVTWSKCSQPISERLKARRDPTRWIPSVSAIATLYDRGCVDSDRIVYAALSVGRAWDAGDRDGLDTEAARKAAELVRDLATMCVDSSSPAVSRDVGQAMRHLLDEMAAVRFMSVTLSLDEISRTMDTLMRSSQECFKEAGFASWSPKSMRRRFLYCLNRHERTDVVNTLISLLFDIGSCPLLSLSDRRTLRLQSAQHAELDRSFDALSCERFFQYALMRMREMKTNGRNTLGATLTSQQLADALSDPTSLKQEETGDKTCNS